MIICLPGLGLLLSPSFTPLPATFFPLKYIKLILASRFSKSPCPLPGTFLLQVFPCHSLTSFSPQLKCHCLKSLPWPLYLKQPTHRFPFLCPALVSFTALNHSRTLYHMCYRSPSTLSVLSCLSLETLSILFTAMHIIEHIKCTY